MNAAPGFGIGVMELLVLGVCCLGGLAALVVPLVVMTMSNKNKRGE